MDRLTGFAQQPGSGGLVLTRELIQKMKDHIVQTAPEEACGLVAGRGNTATLVIPISNLLRSRVRFRMSPEQQLQAFNLIDESGLELQAIFHSHPDGPETPSFTDVAEAYYPEAYSLIWSYASGAWKLRCFTIQEGQVTENQFSIE